MAAIWVAHGESCLRCACGTALSASGLGAQPFAFRSSLFWHWHKRNKQDSKCCFVFHAQCIRELSLRITAFEVDWEFYGWVAVNENIMQQTKSVSLAVIYQCYVSGLVHLALE
jgi:hypothetical protein